MLLGIFSNLELKNLLINQKEDIVLTYRCKVTKNCVNFKHKTHMLNKNSNRAHLWNFGTVLYELLVGMVHKFNMPFQLKCFIIFIFSLLRKRIQMV